MVPPSMGVLISQWSASSWGLSLTWFLPLTVVISPFSTSSGDRGLQYHDQRSRCYGLSRHLDISPAVLIDSGVLNRRKIAREKKLLGQQSCGSVICDMANTCGRSVKCQRVLFATIELGHFPSLDNSSGRTLTMNSAPASRTHCRTRCWWIRYVNVSSSDEHVFARTWDVYSIHQQQVLQHVHGASTGIILRRKMSRLDRGGENSLTFHRSATSVCLITNINSITLLTNNFFSLAILRLLSTPESINTAGDMSRCLESP